MGITVEHKEGPTYYGWGEARCKTCKKADKRGKVLATVIEGYDKQELTETEVFWLMEQGRIHIYDHDLKEKGTGKDSHQVVVYTFAYAEQNNAADMTEARPVRFAAERTIFQRLWDAIT